jgi:hypothetical protein
VNGPQTQGSGTSPLFLSLVGALTLVTGYLFLSASPGAEADARPIEPAGAAVAPVTRCSAPVDQARARALELERIARAHWERGPFDEAELPLAVTSMHEAEHCHALAQDREGRLRTESARALFLRDIQARVERHRVRLEVARREQKLATIVREASALLALYSRTGAQSQPYRTRLEHIARRARAQIIEARSKEPVP